jgi:hypothetical protein
MTKERLYYEMPDDDYRKMLDFFFESNVVIPKGTNRHHDADAVHEWLEDTLKKLQYQREGKWYTDYPFGTDARYRIKPAEPVCEYLWLDLRTPDDFYCPTNKYMTELEAEAYFRPSHTWFKVLETKRIRE